jgi:hypothetical protein
MAILEIGLAEIGENASIQRMLDDIINSVDSLNGNVINQDSGTDSINTNEPTPAPTPVSSPESYPSVEMGFDPAWIENEVIRIRDMWQYDREAISNNMYTSRQLDSGVRAYFDQERLKMIDVSFSEGGFTYSIIYQFENDYLIFAYIADDFEQNRLYFSNSRMFRWRHTPNKNDQGSFIDYDDARGNEMFILWEDYALSEAYNLHLLATR